MAASAESAPLVVRRRPVAISLATLPAVGVAVLAQVLANAPRGLPMVVTAVLLASCAWVAGRLLVSRVRLDTDGFAVRGLASDLAVGYDAIASVSVGPAPLWTRQLLWGLMDPYAVTVHLRDGRSLNPVALWAGWGDGEVERMVSALRSRLDTPAIPRQRGGQRAGADARTSST